MAALRAKPRLLFIAPIRPCATGNGLAMRAGMFLEAFTHSFKVNLLIVPVAGNLIDRSGFAEHHADQVSLVDLSGTLDTLWELSNRLIVPEARAEALTTYPRPALCRHATTPCLERIAALLGTARYEAIHVMRSYMAPYVMPWFGTIGHRGEPMLSIDLDDDEALTHERFAQVRGNAGHASEARIEHAEAHKYEEHEAIWLSRFHLIFTGAEDHAHRIASQYPTKDVRVIANSVTIPHWHPRWPHSGKNVLFVGNLSYPPNVDGLRDFVDHGLPRIQERLGKHVRLRIAGATPTSEVIDLAGRQAVELVANPPDLARHYRWADLAIVPVLAGGGTRIKLLEAFAHRVPVVSTHLGAEGIPAVSGEHLLYADAPEDFAAACVRLLVNRPLSRLLVRNAHKLITARYERNEQIRRIRAVFDPSTFDCSKQSAVAQRI